MTGNEQAARDAGRDDERAFLRALLAGSTLGLLRLPSVLEAAYREYHYNVAASHLRRYWPVVVVAITLVGAALLALGLVPPPLQSLALAGIGGFYVLAAMVALSGWLSTLRAHLEWTVTTVATIALLAIQLATLVVVPPDPLHTVLQFGAVLVTVAVFSLSNLLLRAALAAVLLANAVFILLALLNAGMADWRPYLLYTLGAVLLGFIVAMAQEVRERTVFLQGRLLLLEKRATDAMAAELAELSRTDALTGLVNRRHFDERFAREWASCLRDGEPLGLLFIDVDHFKAYNDHYGHQAGDECLARVGQALAAQAGRATDVVARYGGEEFVALFPRTGREGLAVIAGRIVDAVDALGLPHVASSTAPFVTVSIGVATLVPSAGTSGSRLVQLADEALYRAKHGGRHRYEMAAGET